MNRFKYFLLPILFLLLSVYQVQAQDDRKESIAERLEREALEDLVEEPEITEPTFDGGSSALISFMCSNLKYPVDAQVEGVQGQVLLKFVVTSGGYIKNIEVVRSLYPSCDKEAVRVISIMPRWTPGIQNGKPVNTIFRMPINFVLPI